MVGKPLGVAVVLIAGPALGLTRYVWTNSPSPSTPYSSWSTAAHSIQTALAASQDGDVVTITSGVYRLSSSITLSNALTLRGTDRDACVLDAQYVCRVLAISQTGVVVEALTIARGTATENASPPGMGGGIYAGVETTLRDCLLLDNRAVASGTGGRTAAGGGLYLASSGTLERCDFRQNKAIAQAMEDTMTPGLGAQATARGGGLFGAGFLLNCIFEGNAAAASSDTLSGESGATAHGGGLWLGGGGLRGCLVASNAATATANGTPSQAGALGGGIYAQQIFLESSTLVTNAATATASMVGGSIASGGGLYAGGITSWNSILYYNRADANANWQGLNSLSNGCTTPLPPAQSDCLSQAPLFVSAGTGNYRLDFFSPCVNAGSRQAWMETATDLDARPRILGNRPDMGAYETRYELYVKPSGPGSVPPYTNWATAATNLFDAVAAAKSGYRICVSNGVYALPDALVITQTLELASINGWPSTILAGHGTNRCLQLQADGILVEGFTLTNGFSVTAGGGIFFGAAATVRQARVTGCSAPYGGGVFFGTSEGTLDSCWVDYNCATQGGISERQGGGVYIRSGVEVRNCQVAFNASGNIGGGLVAYDGGRIENCTIVSNMSAKGGGLYWYGSGTALNSIVYGNFASNSPNYTNRIITPYRMDYCCLYPDSPGTGNTTNAPHFVDSAHGNFRLRANSPGVNVGTNQPWMPAAQDLDGATRLNNGVVDMGAFEYEPTLLHLVWSNSPAPGWPFNTWTHAARDIQTAINAAEAGDTVLVTNGLYATGSMVIPGGTSLCRIVINEAITVESVNGPEVTFIEGAPASNGGNGDDAIRGACVNYGTLIGFTVQKGHTRTNAESLLDRSGGGLTAYYSGKARECVLRNNAASLWGGGMAYGTLSDSVVYSNQAAQGGGVGNGKAINCLIYANSAWYGGGIEQASAIHCTIYGNTADIGGGVSSSTLTNCIIYGNAAGLLPNCGDGTANHCCLIPLYGTDCITNAPLFVDAATGNFHLQANSPCVDAGTNTVGIVNDLDEIPRPLDGMDSGHAVADIGCYERVHALADSDQDRMSDQNELTAGTDPLDPLSFLAVAELARTSAGDVLCWPSVDGKQYTLSVSTNLLSGTWSQATNHIPGRWPLNAITNPVSSNTPLLLYRVEVE